MSQSEATPAAPVSTLDADINAALDAVEASAPTAPDVSAPPAAMAIADANAAPSAGPTPAALADDAVVEVIVDGQPVTLPWKEARASVMRHAAFTQKTQKLAAERAAFAEAQQQAEQWRVNGQRAIEEAQSFKQSIMQMLRDPAKLSALYLQATSQSPDVAPAVPTPPAAPAPASHTPTLDYETLRTQLLNDVQLAQQQTAVAHDVTTFTDALIADTPVLKVFGPDLASIVYEKVATMGPTSPAEAKEFIRMQIEDYKSRVSEATGTAAKAAAVAKAQDATAVQRGGSPVVPAKKTYATFNDMAADMEAFLAAQ